MEDETPTEKVDRVEWIAEDEPGKVPDNPLGKRFETIGNAELSNKALENLNRMNVRALDEDEIDAYTDALQGLAYLNESLSEPERNPNAKVDWGEPDDD